MKVELRSEKLSELRKANYVPGVMYGKSIESTNIKVEKQALFDALSQYGKNMTFKIRLDGKYHHVYIKSVQSRVLKPGEILHFDLHRVTQTEVFQSHIPIEIVNQDKFLNKSLFIELVLNALNAEYSQGHGVQSIQVDVSKLELNDKIFVHDLKVSKDIIIKNDKNDVVLVVKERKMIQEEKEETTPSITTERDVKQDNILA